MAHSTQRAARIISEAVQKIHPLTGAPLEPIGSFRAKDGSWKVVWPIMGAAEGDGGEGSDGGGDGGTGGSGSEGQGDGGDGQGGDGDKGDEPKGGTITQEDYDALKRRMQAADKRASDAEAKIKEHEDAQKDELTKATDRVTELEQENKELSEATTQLRIENEFLASNKYTWHNPKRALSLADLSEVTIEDDGKVVGLDKALDALAKSDAYLLKSEKDGEEEPPEGSSGSGAGSGRKGDKKTVDKEALQKKYPALRR